MYHDLLKPGDTFTMMMRKMVIAVCGIAGIIPVMILIQSVMGLTATNSTTLPRYILLTVILISPWIYVKWTHTAPTWLIALWTNSTSVLVLLNLMSNMNAPFEFALIAIMLIVLLCKVPSVNLTAPVTVLLVFGYNFSLGRMGAPFPLMIFDFGITIVNKPLEKKKKCPAFCDLCTATSSSPATPSP